MSNPSTDVQVCQQCSAALPKGRPKFCSDTCRTLANDMRRARRSPCARCGGDKGYGVRGGRYCQPCRDAKGPVWQEMERERGRLRSRKRTEQRGGPRPVKVRAEDGAVWCHSHQDYLPAAAFPTRTGKPASRCRDCQRTYEHEWRLKKFYDIDLNEYHRLYELQEGRCAICQSRPAKTRLAVDHDHETGEVRGLLCKRCNKDILGAAHESLSILRRAVAYLRCPPATSGSVSDTLAEQARFEALVEEAQRGDGWAHDEAFVIVPAAVGVALAQAAGYSVLVSGHVFDPPEQMAFDDLGLVAEAHRRITSWGLGAATS